MPNPKRRHSKTRTAKRRTHDALSPVPVGTCPQCRESKAPHQVCPHCGYYKGRQVRPSRKPNDTRFYWVPRFTGFC